jgi:crotonobetainyl-CoA:carnitine CoA-transferase CaiB-like acyl-CoA transferase
MQPLAGVRVVEAAQMISAPMAGVILAEQGAEVIKIELADGVGDRMRQLGSSRNSVSALFNSVNRGKKSVTLDTKHPDGLQALLDLCATADVFLQNFRPGAAERMGVGEAQLRASNPDLVYVSVSGFGSTGPKAEQKVYDYVIQAMTGMADLQQGDTGSPQLVRQFVVDKTTAVTVSQAITAALFARERGHGGQHVELSMLDIGLWFFWPDGMMDRCLEGDGIVQSSHFADMYSIRRTQDGAVAFVASGNRSWPNLCRAFKPELLDDPRFTTWGDRDANAEALNALFDDAVRSLTTAEAMQRMVDNDVPGARVVTRDQVAADPQVVHNGSLVRLDDGPVGPRVEARPPVRFGDGERAVPAAAPALGADTVAVLESLGYDGDRIASLAANGVFGPVASPH